MEEFFRTQYRAMCNYCEKFGYNFWDVEEMATDVILRYYDEYKDRCRDDVEIRRWMNRRIMLNLKSLYKTRLYSHAQTFTDSYEPAHEDTPEALLCLKQRLPFVPDILIQYTQFKGAESRRGENKSNDRVKFCRARKKFFQQLNAGD